MKSAMQVHKEFCSEMVRRANRPSLTVKDNSKKRNGVITSGKSKAVLAREIAALFA